MITLVKYGDKYYAQNHCEYLVDGEGDVKNLPDNCAPGSVAFTSDLADMWQLRNDNDCVKL